MSILIKKNKNQYLIIVETDLYAFVVPSVVKNKCNMFKKLKDTARNTLRKDQRMNIRISKRDIVNLKTTVLEEGIPYQTLATNIIHKYINGNFMGIVNK